MPAARTRRTRRTRVFDRDAYIGLRCPSECRRRLEEVARRKTRDLSSMALEYIQRGIAESEQELQTTPSRLSDDAAERR